MSATALPLPQRAAQLSLNGLFLAQVARQPDQPALVCGERQWTYRQFNERAQRLAHQLQAMGLRTGDRIAMLSENRPEYVELEMACAKLGLVLACQNWRQSDEELAHCVRLVTPALLVHSARQAAAVTRIEHGVNRLLDLDSGAYEALVSAGQAVEPEVEVDPETGLVILYTSGTTGLPKGALISQRAMVARSLVARIDLGAQPGETFIAWAPLFHMVSTDSAFSTLLSGGKLIVMDGLDVAELVRWTTRERIGHLIVMPGMVDQVIAEIERTGARPLGARLVGAMADLVPAVQIQRITELYNAPYCNSFGSTETGAPPASRGTLAVGAFPERLSKLPNTHIQYQLVDEDDRVVADGEPGELCFRGPTLFSGYWANEEANARDFRGGWFHMGDVFVRNPDGTLDFVDRRKYLIKSGGENIYPAEIERILMAHPQVTEAVVVRKPDPKWGEVPVAFVARKDDSLTGDALKALCRGKIAGYKQPKDVVFIPFEAFPRSTTGKVKRHDLEQMLPKD